MSKIKDKVIEFGIEKILYIFFCLLLTIPSICYYLTHKGFLLYMQEYKVLLNSDRGIHQTVLFGIAIIILFLLYFLILKKADTRFKNIRKVFIYIAIISMIFFVIAPTLSTDIFYYLGVGRINSNYNANPYYDTIRDVFANISQKENYSDTVVLQGYLNYWGNTTVVYGPIWTIICAICGALSFGNITVGVFVIKIFQVVVHLLNAFMIYKLTNDKKTTLIYGLNPFILMYGISDVHNDTWMVLFVLIAIYMLIKKNNIYLSLLFLSMATNIKFVFVLFLPYFVIYYLRDKGLKTRIIGCIKYGLIFLAMFIIPYFIYMKDLTIFTCMFVQISRVSKGIYNLIKVFTSEEICYIVNKIAIIIFGVFYCFRCVNLLLNKNIDFNKILSEVGIFLIIFIFGLLTNFQCWYLIWVSTLFIIKDEKINRIIQILFFACLFTESIYMIKEAYTTYTNLLYFCLSSITILLVYVIGKAKNKNIVLPKKER